MREVVANYRYRPGVFFVAVYLASWTPWIVAAFLASREGGEAVAGLLNLIGLLGPLMVALTLIYSSRSAALKRDFRDRLLNARRIRPLYVLLVIATPPIVIGSSIGISVWFGQSADQFRIPDGGNLAASIVLALILAPIIEETGWRGYGVDSLRAKFGMMKATLLFALLWPVWHAPLAAISGTYQNDVARMDNPLFLANFFVSIVPAAIIANWLYYKNNRSILAAVLCHAMLNAASVVIDAGQVAKCIATLLYSAIAVGIILVDRAAFSEGPRNFLPRVGDSGAPMPGS